MRLTLHGNTQEHRANAMTFIRGDGRNSTIKKETKRGETTDDGCCPNKHCQESFSIQPLLWHWLNTQNQGDTHLGKYTKNIYWIPFFFGLASAYSYSERSSLFVLHFTDALQRIFWDCECVCGLFIYLNRSIPFTIFRIFPKGFRSKSNIIIRKPDFGGRVGRHQDHRCIFKLWWTFALSYL